MTSPRYARIAARLLAQEQPASLEANAAKRARAIETIAEALATKQRQRRLRRTWGLGLAAAVAASAIGYLGARTVTPFAGHTSSESVSALANPSGTGTTIWGAAGSHPLLNVAQLQPGGHLVAGTGGGATIRLSTGTELTVEHDTALAFESAGSVERFFLSEGALQAKVAKLSDGQRFIVRTEDAEVEVRGTAFRVEIVAPDVTCVGGTRTRVSVSEGLVEVRGAGASTYIHAGDSWPVGCAVHTVATASSPASSAPASSAPASSAPASSAPASSARASSAMVSLVKTPVRTQPIEPSETLRTQPVKASPARDDASSIALENELFSKAAASARQGDTASAIGSFEQLIDRYPASPLAESAAVQQMSLLAHRDAAAARDAARQYLVRYPQGYAKADAQKLLARP